jgi:ribosomal protein S18 acetylase RimI-like enzyme
MEMKSTTIRRTRESDLIDALMLVHNTTYHLRRKRGMSVQKSKRPAQPPPILVHLLKSDPEGSFVAHDKKGKLIGFTMALIREDEWYLAFLFVDPTLQSRGLGQKLLRKAMDYGKKNNCKRWALCTFSINPQAVAVYSKMGMPPQRPILAMERSRKDKESFKKLRPTITLTVKEATNDRIINRLVALDRRARHVARPEEHFFWLGSKEYDVLLFHDDKKLVGYAVVNSRGMIAPVVAAKPQYLTSMLAYAIEWGVNKGHKFQIAFIQGSQTEAIQMLLAAGFTIDEVTLLMASEQVTDPRLYIPATLCLL